MDGRKSENGLFFAVQVIMDRMDVLQNLIFSGEYLEVGGEIWYPNINNIGNNTLGEMICRYVMINYGKY